MGQRSSVSEAVADWIAVRPTFNFVVGLVLSALAVWGIWDFGAGEARLTLNPSLNRMLRSDDDARRFYESLLARFGSDDVVVISVQLPSPPTADAFQRLVEINAVLEASPGVHHVDSLATALDMRPVDDDLEIVAYLDPPPSTDEEARSLHRRLTTDELRAGHYLSRDGTLTAFLVTYEPMDEAEFMEAGLDLQALEAVQAVAPDMAARVSGTPHLKAEIGRTLEAEIMWMIPAVLALMTTLSCLFFRSIRIGVIPVIAVGVGLLWTLGIMGWSGHQINVVTTVIPPLVLAIGFAYAAHVVAAYPRLRWCPTIPESPIERARIALRRVAFPVTFTALTTAAGFLSLGTNPLPVIRGFGYYAAVSAGATLLATVSIVPMLLGLAPTHAEKVAKARAKAAAKGTHGISYLDRFFRRLAAFDHAHTTPLLIVGTLVLIASIASASRLQVNLTIVDNFPAGSDIRAGYDLVNDQFGGANHFYVLLDGGQPGAFESPEHIRAVADLQTWLEEQPEIGGTLSFVPYLRIIHRALAGEDVGGDGLPDSESLAAQLLLFGANDELDAFLDPGHQTATILVRSTESATQVLDRLADRIDERLQLLPAGVTGRATGNAILLTRTANQIAFGQATSLALATGMIGLLLIVYFRSLRMGLFALVPNILPVAVYFGLMGLFGVTLNNTTALMGSIVLGIAVDDTLHLLVEYRRALAHVGGESAAALRDALTKVGRPITGTTLAVCIGLLVVGTSALKHHVEFGVLGAATLACAWLVDVTFTPALCVRFIR